MRNRKSLLISISYSLIFVYIAYHAFNGERGIIAMSKLNTELEKSHLILEDLREKRLELEHKVNLLSSDSLDLDLLEEQVKKNLGLADKNELVYYGSPEKK